MMHESLPQKLRVLRAQKGWTLTEAARRAGVGRDTLSDLERGRQHPVMPTLTKIARGYGVPTEDLLIEEEEPTLAGKAEAPEEAGREALSGAYRPRYNVPNTKPAETIEEVLGFGHSPTVEETLEVLYRRWEELANRYASRWEEKLEAGNFTLGEIDECWATLEDLLLELSELNTLEQGAMLPHPDAYGSPATRTGRAIYRINDLFEPLHDAVRSKFGDSELEKQRRKRPEVEASFKDIVRRAG